MRQVVSGVRKSNSTFECLERLCALFKVLITEKKIDLAVARSVDVDLRTEEISRTSADTTGLVGIDDDTGKGFPLDECTALATQPETACLKHEVFPGRFVEKAGALLYTDAGPRLKHGSS